MKKIKNISKKKKDDTNKKKKKYPKKKPKYRNSIKTMSESKFVQLRLKKGPWHSRDDDRVSAFLGRSRLWVQKLKHSEGKSVSLTPTKSQKKRSSFHSTDKKEKGCGIFCGTILGIYDIECTKCKTFIWHKRCLIKHYTDKNNQIPNFDDSWTCPECQKNTKQ